MPHFLNANCLQPHLYPDDDDGDDDDDDDDDDDATYDIEIDGVWLRWLGWDLALIDSRIAFLQWILITCQPFWLIPQEECLL